MEFRGVDDDELDDNFEIIEVGNGRYSSSFHISKHYIGSIIGKKGIMKNRIERDTRTIIKIPRMGEAGNVTILGPSISNVKAACRRINIIVISSRKKQRCTHFLSIPLNDPHIMKSFESFKQQVLQECNNRGVEEAIFIEQQKLHITIGVMCLMDQEERQQVSKLLCNAKDSILMPLLKDHLPLRIKIKGLSYMNDDPKNIKILYGCVQDEHGMTQKLADALVEYFSNAGFVEKGEYGRDNVKLHVTLMNSKFKYRSSEDEVDKRPTRRNIWETFDGSEILNKFGDYDFGSAEVNVIHLSQRKTVGADGYYQSTCVISLNKD
ncbi:unnamed protein product, partial [Iphiclides podalirius]